nr:putative reverse transcriptase domain-containing protein [Tanacetum cinerariifolium]
MAKEEEDRISSLPDFLLVEISSRIKVNKDKDFDEEEEEDEERLMTPKEVIKTTAPISKRWQHLWKKLPTLRFIYFYDGDYYDDFTRITLTQCPTDARLVGDSIGKILSGSPCLETLELDNYYGVSRIDATSKNFKNLLLTNYGMSFSLVKADFNYLGSHRFADSLRRHRDDIEEELLSGLLSSLGHVKDIRLGDYNCLDALSHLRDKDAVNVAQLFFRDIYRLHGLSSSIVSDRHTRFLSHFSRSLWKMVNTQLNFSSAYHPQTDGQTKVVNRFLGNLLRCLVGDHVKAWDQKLCQAEFAHNHAVNRSTGFSLFQLVYSAQPRGPLDLTNPQDADQKRRHVDFEVGDFVWAVLTKDRFLVDVFNVKHLLPYHGNSSDEDSVGNSRKNFVYPIGNDVNPTYTQVNSWIRYAITRNVQELDLWLWVPKAGEEFNYYDELFFNNSCVTRIKLFNCVFNPLNATICWDQLKFLCLEKARLVGDSIGKILSGSPCLETLELDNYYGVSRIDATSKNFKNLLLTNYGMSFSLVKADFNYLGSHRFADSLRRHRDDIEEELLSGLLSSLGHVKDITLGDYNCLDALSHLRDKVGADGDEDRFTELWMELLPLQPRHRLRKELKRKKNMMMTCYSVYSTKGLWLSSLRRTFPFCYGCSCFFDLMTGIIKIICSSNPWMMDPLCFDFA